jgi:hypothetical protein
MPSISATEFTTLPAVRVIVNWADVPSATHVSVFRVDCETGERAQLRPYVAFNGDGYLRASCGMAVFWDTEVPLDRCVRYCTQAENALGVTLTTASDPLFVDSFTRTVVDGWGVATSGQTYTLAGGTVPGDYDVTAGRGLFTFTSLAARTATVNALSVVNGTLYGQYTHPVAPTGANHEAGVRMRFVDGGNFIDMRMFFETGGNVTVAIRQLVAGVETAFAGFFVVPGATTTTPLSFRIDYWGSILRAKVWPSVNPEPATYLATTTVSFFAAGSLSYVVIPGGGSTNAFPYTPAWDNFLLIDTCPNLITIEQCSQDLMISSSGFNMLRDPVRPCNDLHVDLCWTQDPNCVPGRGVFFARLEAEGYASNSSDLQAFNSPRPASASGERSDATSTLALVTRSFEDRDAVLKILRAGSPLLWQSPPEYGIPDRYIQVKDVTVARYNNDHRYQPRAITLPFITEDRPEGPTQGICGARVRDLCDTFTSWDAMEIAGLTYLDLLEGNASPSGPADTNRRRWIDVETGFANWLAVETAPNTWKTLRDGE